MTNYFCFFVFILVSRDPILSEGRSVENGRILNLNNGWDRDPVTEMAQNFSVHIPPIAPLQGKLPVAEIFENPTAENQLATYLVPPPSLGLPEVQSQSPIPQEVQGNKNNFVDSELDPTYHENRPTIILTQDNYASASNGHVEIKTNGYKINTIATASQIMNNSSRAKPGYLKVKVRRKVNVEKFKECIFFQLCEKASCFHYGRFGVCQGQPNAI